MDAAGFLNLNVSNQWPSFELHQVAIGADGALRLTAGAKRGVVRAGPFQTDWDVTEWFRLRLITDGSYGQAFTCTTDAGIPPFDPNADSPFTDPAWQAAPRDLLDTLIPNAPDRFLWIGLLLRGAAAIQQIRVDYGRDTYLPYLPAIYSEDQAARDFLERLLALDGSALGGIEAEINDLPRLFDPAAAPFPKWLDWLNGWLAFQRSERWSEADARAYLAQAFELYGHRGTLDGLKRYLKIYAGVNARIVEPGRSASVWSLGEVSTLGFTTMLAPSALQGAVVGASATLGGSKLTDSGDGSLLFEDIANRFCVQVYCSELNYTGALDTVRAVIDREKPAHTVYDLCTVDARMRIGWQARVGIDAIVAQGLPHTQIGNQLGGTALAAEAQPCEMEEA